MGAWGPGVFENDLAADWVEMFRKDGTPGYLPYTFEDIDINPEFVNEVVSSFVLAAAEVVAAAGSQPLASEWRPRPIDDHSDRMTGLPASVQEWLVRTKFKPDKDLVKLAKRCVSRVLENSEIKDEWQASGHFDEWKQAVDDLLSRLAKVR